VGSCKFGAKREMPKVPGLTGLAVHPPCKYAM
jgi:hypothetical protein